MPAAETRAGRLPLHDWQSTLQACIVDPRKDRTPLHAWLHAGAVDIDTQLDIYANAYVLRLVEALRCNYPALHQALGDADFETMARGYVDLRPSTQASIRWFGDALPGFLRDMPPWRDVPVLGELAGFEWAIRHTIDAADAERWTVDTLLMVPAQDWGELRFGLHPSVSILSLQWNAPPLWQALTDAVIVADGTVPEPARSPRHWLVYRKPDLASGWHSLSATEHAAFTVLQQGGSFADLCAGIAAHADDPARLAADLLRHWVELGLLTLHDPSPLLQAGEPDA